MMDDKQVAATIDKLVSGMRSVIDEMSPGMRRRVLSSIREISDDIADRLEARSSRNH